jgi:hypothetical protein
VAVAVRKAKRSVQALLTAALVLCACGEGELETVTTIHGICTDELRLAVLVTVLNPNELEIDSVTAMQLDEEPCYLENRRSSVAVDDAGMLDEGALYSCWEQGVGVYEVRVQSGKQSWTETVPVPGNTCHVTKVKRISIELK